MATGITMQSLKRPSVDNGVYKGQKFVQVWNALLPVMDRIFDGEELKNQEYMSLYSLVYDFASCGDAPIAKSGRFTGPHILQISTWELTLYQRIEQFITKKVKTLEPLLAELENKDENRILQFYVENANGFFIGTKQLNGICRQINIHMVKKAISCEYHRIEHLAYMCWRQGIFNKVGRTVTDSILHLLRKEREGEIIKSENIVAVISSLTKIGYNPRDLQTIRAYMLSAEVMALPANEQEILYTNRLTLMELSFYKSLFEVTFLKDTRSWFTLKLEELKLLANNEVGYVNSISLILKEEIARVRNYFHPSTEASVIDVIVDIAVSKEREIFFAAIPKIFEIHRLEEGYEYKKIADFLSDIDQLCNVNAEDKEALLNNFKTQIRAEINVRLASCSANQKINPQMYIKAFQNTYNSFVIVLTEANLDIECYKNTLQMAIVDALAKNAVTESKRVDDFSENTFAVRLHQLLTQKSANYQEVKESCSTLITFLFPLLPNKISFEYRYRNNLMNRIVEKTSVSNELEFELISKMQAMSGIDYTVNLSKLLQEGTVISNDMLQSYKKSLKDSAAFNFDITVFPGNSCPWSSANENLKFVIASELNPAYESFQKFYGDTRKNQKLQWLHSRSKGELEASCFNSRKYILVCSVYQMAVMLMFNTVDSRTFEDIVVQTGLNAREASMVVHQLAKAQLLLLERKESDNSVGVFSNEDVVKLNLGFTSKNMRVIVNAAVRMEQEQKDDDKASKDAAHAMSFVVQATIVRLMKANQKMTHSALVSEVIADMIKSGKCKTVPVSTIKAAIETLIEKEFIKRLETDNNTYQYIS